MGVNVYHMINWFFMFSFFGYLLECIVLSYEYRTPVINRGFGHGPFCIIYGFGALGACIFLQPFASQPLKLYLATSIMATTMELVTAHLMIRLFGSFWWDYSHKWMNYKGIICVQSSVPGDSWGSSFSASSMVSYTGWWAISRAALRNGRHCACWPFISVISSIASDYSSAKRTMRTSLCLDG